MVTAIKFKVEVIVAFRGSIAGEMKTAVCSVSVTKYHYYAFLTLLANKLAMKNNLRHRNPKLIHAV